VLVNSLFSYIVVPFPLGLAMTRSALDQENRPLEDDCPAPDLAQVFALLLGFGLLTVSHFEDKLVNPL